MWLRVLALRGDAKTAEMARTLLKQTEKLRDERAELTRAGLPQAQPVSGAFATTAVSPARGLCCPDRRIHDGQFRAALPGPLVRSEGDDPTGIPDAGCPEQVSEVFLADRLPAEDGADYVRVTVGGDGTCLATDTTPAAERRTAVFLKAPPDAREWVTAAGIPQPPVTPCAAPGDAAASSAITAPLAVAAITSPRATRSPTWTIGRWLMLVFWFERVYLIRL